MFTGLVEEMGRVEAMEEIPEGARLVIGAAASLDGLRRGDSIAVNGVCQTVIDRPHANAVTMVAVGETLARTNFGDLREGSAVNLERPLRVGDRLAGHWVTGHVDAVGYVREVRGDAKDWAIRIEVPRRLGPYVVEKGSIAIDGVSMTVGIVEDAGGAEVAPPGSERGGCSFWVHVIPETLERTLFGAYRAGVPVNIETDLLGKYVLRARELSDPGGQP